MSAKEAIAKSLESWIWEAACSIRWAKDARKYSDCILPLIFHQFVSDKFEERQSTRLADSTHGH